MDNAKIETLRISDEHDGFICTYKLKYTLNINAPEYINSDIIMHTDEGYEVAESTTFYDIDDKEVLVKANINVYKKPHKGWNYRLKSNIWLCIFNDGRIEHGCM